MKSSFNHKRNSSGSTRARFLDVDKSITLGKAADDEAKKRRKRRCLKYCSIAISLLSGIVCLVMALVGYHKDEAYDCYYVEGKTEPLSLGEAAKLTEHIEIKTKPYNVTREVVRTYHFMIFTLTIHLVHLVLQKIKKLASLVQNANYNFTMHVCWFLLLLNTLW